MYFTSGLVENIKTIALLSYPYLECPSDQRNVGRDDLKAAYQKMLKTIQAPVTTGNSLEVEWITDLETSDQLRTFYGQTSQLNDLGQASMIQQGMVESKLIERAQNSLEALQKESEELGQLFRLAQNRIFFAPSLRAGGGSTSAAIGVLWIHPRNHWRIQDYTEFLVHELTHTFMFLDERRYQHYFDYQALAMPENFGRSAVLRRPRPLDKTIHSLVVAAEVLSYRNQIVGHPKNPGLHPRSEIMVDSCQKSIASIRDLKNLDKLVTPRAIQLINSSENLLNKLRT